MKNWLGVLNTLKGRVLLKTSLRHADSATSAGRVIVTASKKGKYIGRMETVLPWKKDHATVVDTMVDMRETKLGISSGMFKQTLKKLSEIGRKHLRTQEIIHPAQVNIRAKYKTKFLLETLEGKKLKANVINSNTAKNVIVSNRQGVFAGSVMASTQVPKPTGIKFIRRNGRVIPIRIKK